jgi:hypothetical protein
MEFKPKYRLGLIFRTNKAERETHPLIILGEAGCSYLLKGTGMLKEDETRTIVLSQALPEDIIDISVPGGGVIKPDWYGYKYVILEEVEKASLTISRLLYKLLTSGGYKGILIEVRHLDSVKQFLHQYQYV